MSVRKPVVRAPAFRKTVTVSDAPTTDSLTVAALFRTNDRVLGYGLSFCVDDISRLELTRLCSMWTSREKSTW
jgi:hypothetical protein